MRTGRGTKQEGEGVQWGVRDGNKVRGVYLCNRRGHLYSCYGTLRTPPVVKVMIECGLLVWLFRVVIGNGVRYGVRL